MDEMTLMMKRVDFSIIYQSKKEENS